jgi:Cu2+-exporting ATPase
MNHEGHDRSHARSEEQGGTGDEHHQTDHTGHEEMFRRRFWVSLVLSVPVLYWSETIQEWFGYTAPEFTGSDLIVPVVSTVIFIYGGIPFLRMAIPELRNRQPAMMTLISLAITVAFAFSMSTVIWQGLGENFFWELVTLIDVMLLGHWIEMRSVRIASGALEALADLMPDEAEVIGDDDSVETRPVSELREGDRVLVRPGASVPADGTVLEGDSDLDESMITGESRPVSKSEGDGVIGGTVNSGNGALRVKLTAIGDETALAGIMRLVEEARASKSPTQLLADRAAAFLFYAALVAAAITTLVWSLVQGGFDQQVVARVVTVLVIACPHALGLAIPLVVANTTSIAAKNGTLIRNRESIDTARNLEVIAIDKTGTLTEGRMGIDDLKTVEGVSADKALRIAAAAEGDSEHLLARAIREEARSREIEVSPAEDFEIEKGRGVAATVEGREVHVGGPRLIESLEVELPLELAEFAETVGGKGHTAIHVVQDGEPIATIALADVVREESHPTIESLHEMGIEVAMITGDSEDVARSVAEELEIDTYYAQVLPEDKDKRIQDLQSGGRMVGMVGDGVNDAPALTRADIGIAIGSGTDVAIQSADLVLVKSNPLDIVKILRLSTAAYRKQQQNIWWAAGYNIVMIPLAAGVLAPWGFVVPPALGALVMSISTVVVAINAQLLRRVDLG